MECIRGLQADPNFLWSPKLTVRTVEGRGLSVVCTESINAGELLIRVPPSQLLIGTHIELAKRLILMRLEHANKDASENGWISALPATFDFMPAQWPSNRLALLPERYLKVVSQQQREIAELATELQVPISTAAWGFFAVNSRCLWWPRGMALAPALDFLNHSSTESGLDGLEVRSELKNGITARARKTYLPEQEVTFSYGPHENGRLLVEYGFVEAENKWDFVDISLEITELISKGNKQKLLTELGYWGDYTLGFDGPSFRVELALASLEASDRQLRQLAAGLLDVQRFQQTIKTHTTACIDKVASKLDQQLAALANETDFPAQILKIFVSTQQKVLEQCRAQVAHNY